MEGLLNLPYSLVSGRCAGRSLHHWLLLRHLLLTVGWHHDGLLELGLGVVVITWLLHARLHYLLLLRHLHLLLGHHRLHLLHWHLVVVRLILVHHLIVAHLVDLIGVVVLIHVAGVKVASADVLQVFGLDIKDVDNKEADKARDQNDKLNLIFNTALKHANGNAPHAVG